MNISVSWLRHYLKTDLATNELADLLTDIGLEVESVEKVESVKGGLEGMVVGEILTCDKHPDADRLKITTVNVGEAEPLQIVCGAPNAAAGQKVIVALNGAKLFPSEGDPFTIKKSKIRGVESNGMICAEDEIGLGKGHDGIMVLPAEVEVGLPAARYFQLESDEVISIGLTPNRVDAASHYGVARDLYAAIRFRGGKAELEFPHQKPLDLKKGIFPVKVRVEDQESCKRYAGITIGNIKVAPSPQWLQNRLIAIGARPINNVVDITNFVMHELGQPLHAFDASAIGGNTIVVRKAKSGKRFITLDDVERELRDVDTMICDEEKELCIAGVFGGSKSGVNDSTQRIFLESAWFDPAHVRKTARGHGLNTDSSFRFERGADPDMVVPALHRAAELIVELCGGVVESDISDFYPVPFSPFEVDIDPEQINKLIGTTITPDEMQMILALLSIKIVSTNKTWSLQVPPFRVDVQRPADIAEEILRIYGYNRVPLPARMSSSLNPALKPDRDAVRHTVSDLLSSNGFFEILSNSLTRSDYAALAGSVQMKEEWHVRLLNPLSSELDVMRQTLLFSGLEAISHNLNRQQLDLRFYEFGKIYFHFGNGKYEEQQRLSLFLTGRRETESWNASNNDVSFFTLKSAVMNVFSRLGLSAALRAVALDNAWFEDGQALEIAKKKVAEFGWIRGAITKKMDIRQTVFYADIHWDVVLGLLHMNKVKYKEISKFPEVRRDLSLLLDEKITFSEIENIARQSEKKLLREVGLFDVYQGKNLESGKKSYALRFVLQDPEQTLTDQVIDKTMEKIQLSLEQQLGAQLRS